MKKLLERLNMSCSEFSKEYKIPYNTVLQWKNGIRQAPKYLITLIERLNEKNNINKKTIENFTNQIEEAIVNNTYPDFDKNGKPVNIWKANTGFNEIEKTKKNFLKNN